MYEVKTLGGVEVHYVKVSDDFDIDTDVKEAEFIADYISGFDEPTIIVTEIIDNGGLFNGHMARALNAIKEENEGEYENMIVIANIDTVEEISSKAMTNLMKSVGLKPDVDINEELDDEMGEGEHAVIYSIR